MWGKILRKLAGNDNQAEISFLEVKELYDAAFAEKAKARVNLKKFRSLIQKAEKLDALYRQQLALTNAARYQEAA
ncbi:MAG: hypothetical protein AAF549_09015 [Pseudomonadota bacterium]